MDYLPQLLYKFASFEHCWLDVAVKVLVRHFLDSRDGSKLTFETSGGWDKTVLGCILDGDGLGGSSLLVKEALVFF